VDTDEGKMIKMNAETIILYRRVGPKELALIRASGHRAFPPRLPQQPIFYPVLNQEYARQIARNWNVKDSGSGYVTRFAVRKEFCRTICGPNGRQLRPPGIMDSCRGLG